MTYRTYVFLALGISATATLTREGLAAGPVEPSTRAIATTSSATTRAASRPALSPKAQALLDALRGNQNTHGQPTSNYPTLTPNEMKELTDGGYLEGLPIDGFLPPMDD